MALKLGLPVAPFDVVDIPTELIIPGTDLELEQLGSGPCFGSLGRELTTELRFGQIELLPVALRREIAVFDRWIRNYDRSLSIRGGNPNLLWANDEQTLVMIDHNNAFDCAVDLDEFVSGHVFGRDFLDACHDPDGIASYRARLDKALVSWEEIISAVPSAWLFLDKWETVPTDFSFDEALAVLHEHHTEGFWS
ncbi:MAG: hypothetical protein K5878_03240 [Rhizobiaceae bacterium]|nr:hypothetical protein [Rhizobiaceae bacterium]